MRCLGLGWLIDRLLVDAAKKKESKTRGLNRTHVELRPHALPRERK